MQTNFCKLCIELPSCAQRRKMRRKFLTHGIITLRKQTPLLMLWATQQAKRYLAAVCVCVRERVQVWQIELACAEKQDGIVDPILVKASYKSLREWDCWRVGAGALIPECRQWWTAGEQMGRQVLSAKMTAWNELCLSSVQTQLGRIGAAVPRESACNSSPSSLSR